jgi:hypothetical protein
MSSEQSTFAVWLGQLRLPASLLVEPPVLLAAAVSSNDVQNARGMLKLSEAKSAL